MTTEEGNRIIAEFMGGVKSKIDGKGRWIRFAVPQGGTDSYAFWPSKILYHSSWDWLMPVVEKIKDLGWQFQLNSYSVSNDARFINGENYIQNVAWSTTLLATYNVVIDFIDWYNKNK